MNVYLKSAIYLVGFSALGYVLSEITTPSKEKLAEIKRQQGITSPDSTSQKALFMKTLKEASENKDPIYLKKSKSE